MTQNNERAANSADQYACDAVADPGTTARLNSVNLEALTAALGDTHAEYVLMADGFRQKEAGLQG